ncbi:MAG: argininosuccinate lyase [Lentisphaeria bacterium]|nr:argininosuccinate lyase [Lentisphaeria bacterium]NQZ69844.1 argininosuccinate lyase [Lentisphaeria bacterium]
MALWGARFSSDTNELLAKLSESISFDQRLYAQDIAGSIAHVKMLAKQSIIPKEDAKQIIAELGTIKAEIEAGDFEFKESLEDIHMNIESRLIERLGDAGARVHTGRSRNDQIATDIRLYLRDEISEIKILLSALQKSLVTVADADDQAILPGFTHLQHAQPVLFAHHLLAYVEMFSRDMGRLEDCAKRMNVSPLGAGAMAGSTFPMDREFVAKELGFDSVSQNSMDAVSDRDFAVELLSALSLIMLHISRLSEDIIFWKSQEASFIDLGDAFCTGSSIMPQKKNPDTAELGRGKAARVFADLNALLILMKGLPMCYNRDMQEDKEPVFDAVDTTKLVLATFAPMIESIEINQANMATASSEPALMATDLAEWLVKDGMPFRTAHHRVGSLVAWCNENSLALDAVSLEQMQISIPEAKAECLDLFSAENSVKLRDITGGTAPKQVRKQIDYWKKQLK